MIQPLPETQSLTELPLTLLYARCQQETRRFWQGRPYNPAYCHALFGRALAEPLADLALEKMWLSFARPPAA